MQLPPTKNASIESAGLHIGDAPIRFIGIDPFSRGFAYVVFENFRIIDWRTIVVEGPARNERCVQRLVDLLQQYDPERLIIEDPTGSRRQPRICELLDRCRSAAERRGIAVRRIKWETVVRFWSDEEAPTKYQIATAIAEYYTELAPRLPRKRRCWDSQDPGLSIFCAAALVMTYFWLRVVRSRIKTNAA